MEYLNFQHAGRHYCIRMSEVSEVLNDRSFLRIPRMPACFDGLFQLRGRLITVLNLMRVLEIMDSAQMFYIVVFAPPYQHFGIRVPGTVETRFISSLEVSESSELGDVVSDGEHNYCLLQTDKMMAFSKK